MTGLTCLAGVFGIVGLVAVLAGAPLATAQKAAPRVDGLYEFTAKGFTGTLAVRSVKGGLLFVVETVSPKGATCSASGRATGGSALTFRHDNAGFRLLLQRDQITISGLLGRVSDAAFCGLNGMLTGVYRNRGPLDAAAASSLSALDKAVPKP